jgi:hypothetical protein
MEQTKNRPQIDWSDYAIGMDFVRRKFDLKQMSRHPRASNATAVVAISVITLVTA